MAEAQLRIKPTVIGSVRSSLARDQAALRSVDREQRRAIASGIAGTRKLERGWDGVARSGRAVAGVLGGVSRQVLSLRGLVAGLGVAAGGKTFFDLTIGSNAQLERQKITFETMIGDVKKASDLMARLRENAAKTPFQEADVFEGSKRLLRLTQGNIDQNIELLKVAESMAAINSDKTVVDAVEAILDAETGEFERLKEFGIKLRKSDVDKMKKRGESLGQAALRGVTEAVGAQTGGRDVVAALSMSFEGKMSTLKDRVKNQLRDLSSEAFEETKVGLDAFGDSLEELLADNQFRSDLDAMAKSMLEMAKGATKFATEIPGGIREIRAFLDEHGDLLKTGAGLFAADRLTGGALHRGAAGMAGAAGRRLLLGRKASGVAGAAMDMTNPIPVYVVNMGGGMGDDSFFGRTSRVVGKGAPLTTAGLLKSGGLAGAASSIGAGGAFGLLAIPGAFALAAKALVDATEGTSSALKALEERLQDTGKVSAKSVADRAMREHTAERRARQRTGLTGGFRQALDRAVITRDVGEKNQIVNQALARATESLRVAQTSEQRGQVVEALNEQLAGYNVRATAEGDRLKFSSANGGRSVPADELNAAMRSVTNNNTFQITGTDKEEIRQGVLEALRDMEREESRTAPR